MARSKRNAFVERWSGREWALRQYQGEAGKACVEAARAGNADEAPLHYGQDAGLIDSVEPAEKIISDIVRDADEIIRSRLQSFLRPVKRLQ